MSIKKDPYMWLWVGSVVIAIIGVIVAVIVTLGQPKVTLHLGDGIFKARVARTDAQHEKGLSGTRNLAKNQALLFIFADKDQHGIWMKDMMIPIDVVWLDDEKKVIHVEHDVQPDSYPTVYRPNGLAKYIVELPAGTARARVIRVGAIAQFEEKEMAGIFG